MVPRVALVGTSGYGTVQLGLLQSFAKQGKLNLGAAVVFEPNPSLERDLAGQGCRVFPRFEDLVRAWPQLDATLCVLPTPIHLHVPMTTAMLEAGANVLVEKPLAPTVSGALRLGRLAEAFQRTLAVGFQYLHAPEVGDLKRRLLDGEIGRIERIDVEVQWPRGQSYYRRNAWAGRARVEGEWVLDSPVNNAMSHFLLLMLFLAGEAPQLAAMPVLLQAELYRAQAIETFDTAVLRMRTASGVELAFAGTHSSRETVRPIVRITGTKGCGAWVQDAFARLDGPAGRWEGKARPEADTREAMLSSVLARLRGEDAFICDAGIAAWHVRIVEALRLGGCVHEVPAEERLNREEARDTFTYVRCLGAALSEALRRRCSLRQTGLSWARPPLDVPLTYEP